MNKWIFKLIAGLLPLVCGLPPAGWHSPAHARSNDGEMVVLARVGREKITRNDLVGVLDEYQGLGEEEVLSRVLETRLLALHAGYAGLEAKDRDVEAELEKMIASFPSLIDFYRHIEERGLTVRQVRRRLEERALAEQLVAREVSRRVTVDPRELRDFIDENRSELVLLTTRVRLEAAFFAPGETVPDNPVVLDALMKDQGELTLGDLAPPLRGIVQALEPGRFSDPVEIAGAVTVIRVAEKPVDATDGHAGLVFTARRLLYRQKHQEAYNRFVRELREKTSVEFFDL